MMYQHKQLHFVILVATITLKSTSQAATNEETLPTPEDVNDWAGNLRAELVDKFKEHSEFQVLKDSYIDDLSSVRFESVKAKEVLPSMAAKITEIFTKRTMALKDIVTAAEDETFIYDYDPKLKLPDVPLFTMPNSSDSPELEYDPHLQREVSWNQSGVHTPLEVYEGYTDVLNGLRWSAAVDRTFRANRARDPAISWQYLGSQLGFMRLYPATWWQAPEALDSVDLYDVRRRPWYIEGSVSPKDVIIIMDISGSVHGQTLEIMKISVKTVLNTLGENDYVNIAWSTNMVGWVDPCIDALIPATMVNKRALFHAVDNMEARNTSNWALGLDFAYNAFIEFYETQPEHAGANCHKLIMLFSDGGTEWPGPGDVIKKYENHTITKDVRIFTYALGPHPIPSHILKRLACENNGTFSTIVASGAIRTTIQDSYTSVLGRPLAMSGSHPTSESPPYLDAAGLGFVTTLSMPIFNRSEASDGQSLLGVAGVDITVAELVRHSPVKHLGPFGYTFAINPNGIVLFHPRLQEPLHYMEDPPDLDLTVLEGDSQAVKNIRTQMIRRNTDDIQMDQTVDLGDGHAVDLRSLTFSWRPVDNTTLSLGLVMPEGLTRAVVSGQPYRLGLGTGHGCLLAPSWRYCENITATGADRWQQLSDRLRDGAEHCDLDLVQQLKWDTLWTADAAREWARTAPPGVLTQFVITDGGLTRFHPNTSEPWLTPHLDPYKSGLYRQASLTDDLVLRPSAEHQYVAVVRRIAVSQSTGTTYALGAAGVHYSTGWVRRLTQEALNRSGWAQPDLCSDHNSPVHCYLLDDAAVVIYSNKHGGVNNTASFGRFLGRYDPELMTALLNSTVYRQTISYNYQGVCKKQQEGASAATWLRAPFLYAVQLLLDTSIGLINLLHYLSYIVMSYVWSVQTAAVSGLDEFGFEIHAYEHACTQRVAQYQLTTGARRTYQGEAYCTDQRCTRMFSASLVSETNLLLVVANAPCACEELLTAELPLQPEEVVGPDRCVDDKTPLFRKRPDTCFARNENEKPSCSGAGAGAVWRRGPLLLLLLPCLLLAVRL